MTKLITILIFSFLVACNSSDKKNDSQSKANSQKIKEELIGVWKCDQSRSEPKNETEKITMTIFSDGRIVYDIEDNGVMQGFDLIYGVRGDTLLTSKLTDPTEIKSLIKFENINTLILEAYGNKSTFIRSGN